MLIFVMFLSLLINILLPVIAASFYAQINIHLKNFNFQITYYMFLVFFIRMWYFFVFMVKFLKKSCRAIFLFTSLETISCGLKTSLKIVLFGKNTSRGKVFACKVPLHDQSHFLNYSSIIDN